MSSVHAFLHIRWILSGAVPLPYAKENNWFHELWQRLPATHVEFCGSFQVGRVLSGRITTFLSSVSTGTFPHIRWILRCTVTLPYAKENNGFHELWQRLPAHHVDPVSRVLTGRITTFTSSVSNGTFPHIRWILRGTVMLSYAKENNWFHELWQCLPAHHVDPVR